MYQTKHLAKKIAYLLDFHKGENVVIKNVENKTPLARFYIFVSADNQRKLNGLKQEVLDIIGNSKASINHVEDSNNTTWVVIDANDIVIHIFTTETRAKYRLDEIYKDCPNIDYSTYKGKKTI